MLRWLTSARSACATLPRAVALSTALAATAAGCDVSPVPVPTTGVAEPGIPTPIGPRDPWPTGGQEGSGGEGFEDNGAGGGTADPGSGAGAEGPPGRDGADVDALEYAEDGGADGGEGKEQDAGDDEKIGDSSDGDDLDPSSVGAEPLSLDARP